MTKRKKELKKKLAIAGVWFFCGVAAYVAGGYFIPKLILSGRVHNYKVIDAIAFITDVTYIVGALVGVGKAVKALHDSQ